MRRQSAAGGLFRSSLAPERSGCADMQVLRGGDGGPQTQKVHPMRRRRDERRVLYETVETRRGRGVHMHGLPPGNGWTRGQNVHRVWLREATRRVLYEAMGQERGGWVEMPAMRDRKGSTPRTAIPAVRNRRRPRGKAVHGMRPLGKRRSVLADAMGEKSRGVPEVQTVRPRGRPRTRETMLGLRGSRAPRGLPS